jgi:hypothetical protein
MLPENYPQRSIAGPSPRVGYPHPSTVQLRARGHPWRAHSRGDGGGAGEGWERTRRRSDRMEGVIILYLGTSDITFS